MVFVEEGDDCWYVEDYVGGGLVLVDFGVDCGF